MLHWLQLIEVIAPPILAVIPGMPATLIPIIVRAIQLSEQLPWLTGVEKKELVMKAVGAHVGATAPDVNLNPAATDTIGRAIDASVHAANTAQTMPAPVVTPTPAAPIIVTVDPTPALGDPLHPLSGD